MTNKFKYAFEKIEGVLHCFCTNPCKLLAPVFFHRLHLFYLNYFLLFLLKTMKYIKHWNYIDMQNLRKTFEREKKIDIL